MRVQARILAIKLLEKQEKNPEYLNHLGIQVNMVKKDREPEKRKQMASVSEDIEAGRERTDHDE